jgi:protein-tyrosine phosphatase
MGLAGDEELTERILFVCTANVDRSRTAEDLYREDPRYEVRSAGTAPFATTALDRELVSWADRIFVMNERQDRHESQLKMRFPGVVRRIVDLDIEDRWYRGDPELVRRLLDRLEPHLGPPQGLGRRASAGK